MKMKTTTKNEYKMKTQPITKKENKMKMHRTLAALSVALLTMAGPAFSAHGQEDDDPWRFSAALPLWAPRVDGNITLLGHQGNVDIGFNKLKDNLDTAFSLGLEARCRQFGFYSSVGYMKFSGTAGNAYAQLKLTIAEGGGFYRFVQLGEDHPFILEGLVGVRYWNTDTSWSSPIPILNGGRTRNLADPIIGLRGSQGLFSKCHLDFQADVGGFDINNDTDITWSAGSVITYDFFKWFSVSAGYRALSIDESNGSGSSQNGLNIIMHGPLIVAKITF